MILHELTLQNFRSYIKQKFIFSSDITLFVGKNTAGKTNVIEAIFCLATGRSFRADVDREMIRWGEEIGRVIGKTEETKLDYVLTRGEVSGRHAPLKSFQVNGVSRRLIDFVGNVRAVLFWPEHMELVTDSPSLRRRYLDSVLIQVDREYRRNLLSYERGLRQRNKLLDAVNEGKASGSQLLFWNQLLIKSGSYITDKRDEFIHFINQEKQAIGHYRLVYDKSVISDMRLAQYQNEEIAAKATLVGPHRDDFVFMKEIRDKRKVINKTSDFSSLTPEVSLSSFGSRGEQRLGILWLKLAEVSYVEKITGERPMLLLDDIFSELDEQHRDLIFQIMKKQQTIVTTADNDVASFFKNNYSQLNVIPLKG